MCCDSVPKVSTVITAPVCYHIIKANLGMRNEQYVSDVMMVHRWQLPPLDKLPPFNLSLGLHYIRHGVKLCHARSIGAVSLAFGDIYKEGWIS